MIKFTDISKKYASTEVLNIADLEISEGEHIGLIGNNGAGKTTCFSLLLDLIEPSTGQVTSDGNVVSKSELWKEYTSSFLDESYLINFLTPDEYFDFVGSLYGWNEADIRDFLGQYEEFFNDEVIGQKKYIRDLSKGNQKKVGIIAALMGNPRLLVLDEPFSNLDPTSQIRLKRIIKASGEDKTVLISSHDLNHVVDVCDRILILEKGNLIKDLKNTPEAQAEISAYFDV